MKARLLRVSQKKKKKKQQQQQLNSTAILLLLVTCQSKRGNIYTYIEKLVNENIISLGVEMKMKTNGKQGNEGIEDLTLK